MSTNGLYLKLSPRTPHGDQLFDTPSIWHSRVKTSAKFAKFWYHTYGGCGTSLISNVGSGASDPKIFFRSLLLGPDGARDVLRDASFPLK